MQLATIGDMYLNLILSTLTVCQDHLILLARLDQYLLFLYRIGYILRHKPFVDAQPTPGAHWDCGECLRFTHQ